MDRSSKDKLLQLVLQRFAFPREEFWFQLLDETVNEFWHELISDEAREDLTDWVKATTIEELNFEAISDIDEVLLLLCFLKGKELPVKLKTREMTKRIVLEVETTVERLILEGKKYIFNLNGKNITDTIETELRILVQCLPELLHHKAPVKDYVLRVGYELEDVLPIQNLMIEFTLSERKNMSVMRLIPVLAEEGLKYNVGGDGMIGGLLCTGRIKCDEDGEARQFEYKSVLQSLVTPTVVFDGQDANAQEELFDSICVDVLKKLRKMNLLTEKEVITHNLLVGTYHDTDVFAKFKKQTFEYLVQWAPTALEYRKSCCRMTVLHSTILYHPDIDIFKTVLKAGLKYYPHGLGLLFHRRNQDWGVEDCDGDCSVLGTSAIGGAYEAFGREEAWNAIKECLDETNEVLKISPRMNIYPFMLVAGGCTTRTLDLVYYLLRQDPSVITCALDDTGTANKRARHN